MTSRHSLDLGNRPIPFKIYTELPSISLQSEFPIPSLNAIPSISNIHPKRPNTKDSGIITTKNNSNSEEINATKTFTLKEDMPNPAIAKNIGRLVDRILCIL
jgi:hypothetical protein